LIFRTERIKTLEPFYRNGSVFHAAWMKGKDLEEQLETFPKGKRDDIIDAESMCLPLLYPGTESKRAEDSEWDQWLRIAQQNMMNKGFLDYGR